MFFMDIVMFWGTYLSSSTFPVTLILVLVVYLIDVVVSILFRLMSIPLGPAMLPPRQQ
jgi:hypothetical protein